MPLMNQSRPPPHPHPFSLRQDCRDGRGGVEGGRGHGRVERGVPVRREGGVGQGPAQAQGDGQREHDEGRARGGTGGRILASWCEKWKVRCLAWFLRRSLFTAVHSKQGLLGLTLQDRNNDSPSGKKFSAFLSVWLPRGEGLGRVCRRRGVGGGGGGGLVGPMGRRG